MVPRPPKKIHMVIPAISEPVLVEEERGEISAYVPPLGPMEQVPERIRDAIGNLFSFEFVMCYLYLRLTHL